MTPRLFVDAALAADAVLALPANAARHVQVLRLQPGAALTLFDGRSGQWSAQVHQMGRKEVRVQVLAHQALERELARAVTLAPGMPANERMDGLVEKATELGAVAICPLMCERSLLRVMGERAERKAEHWRAVAIAACEQSGRNRVPNVAAPQTLRDWLAALAPPLPGELRWVLSLGADAQSPPAWLPAASAARQVLLLSGPEGGLSPAEEALARAAGCMPLSLGERVLRADTAPLAALAWLSTLPNPPDPEHAPE